MLKSSLLAISSITLIGAAFFFPNQSPGLFVGGLAGGLSTYYVAEKERNFNKRLQDIKLRERNLSDSEQTVNYLKNRYTSGLNEVDQRKKELEKLQEQIDAQQQEINKLASLKLALEQEQANLTQDQQRWNDSKTAEAEQLKNLKAELNEKHRFLIGLSAELEVKQRELEELRSQLALAQEHCRVKESELEKRRVEFEQGCSAYEDAVRRAEEAKVELHIIKEVEKRVTAQSKPFLEDLERQRQDLASQKAEFQLQITAQESERVAFAERSEAVAQMLEQQAQADEEAKLAAIAEVEEAKKQIFEELQSRLNAKQKEHDRQIMLHKQALLLARSELSKAIQPDFIKGTSKWDLLGDEVARVLRLHGIYAKDPVAREINGGQGFEYSFKVLPLRVVPPERQVKGKEIPVHPLSDGEAIDIISRKAVGVDLVSAIPGASLKKLKADALNGRIKLYIYTAEADWEDESFERSPDKGAKIVEPPANYVEKVSEDSKHVKICGFSQSGKSTLGNNIACTQKAIFESQGRKVSITIIDPKPITEWDLPVQYEGLDKAMDGLIALDAEITRRINFVKEQKKKGISREVISQQLLNDISIWVIDEADDVISEWDDNAELVQEIYEIKQKRPASKRIKRGAKVGAALGVIIDLIGQSPLPDDLNMRRNDLNHFTNIYIGFKTIPTGIEDCVFSKLESSDLYAQLNLRRIREELQEEREQKTGEKPDRYALFSLNTGKTFLATLPRPGECAQRYTVQGSGTISKESESVEGQVGESEAEDSNSGLRIGLLKASLDKGLGNLDSQDLEDLKGFTPPENPCSLEGSISPTERQWAKWLWHIKKVRNKKIFIGEIWGVKGHSGTRFSQAQERLKILNEQEGLGLKWEK